jgi:ribonuclease HI
VLVKDVSSVVMAEAAALAMAASIAIKFGFMQVSFLTDSSKLQQFLSTLDQNNPPDWRMLTYTQQYLSSTTQIQASLFKISRTDNLEADSLAKEAHLQVASVHQPSYLHCSFGAHPSVPVISCSAFCKQLMYFDSVSSMLLK